MLWALLLSACTNSGLGKPTIVGTADTAPPPAADCLWVGTWNLSAFKCGTFDYDTFWDNYTGASMVISQNATTGCDVVATINGNTCAQTEGWTFGPPLGTEVDVTRNGVTACAPDGCALEGRSCAVGGNTFATTTLTIDDSLGDLTAIGLMAEAGAGCPLDIVTTWTMAR